MLTYPYIDPIALSIGPLKIHWYGIAYLCGLLIAGVIARRQCRRPNSLLPMNAAEDLIFYSALGMIIGGRVGYVLFYGFDHFLQDPLWLIKIWTGGMSFHGGLIGVIIALSLFAKRRNVSFIALGDFIAPTIPLGLLFGRLANFVGQELWGRPTDHAWAMIFPRDPLQLPRHPSQLYEAFFEGFVLFIILFWLSQKPRAKGLLSGVFLCGYALFRFAIEWLREPDAPILFHWMTRGQLLCLPMFVGGLMLFYYAWQQQKNNRLAK